MVPSFLIDPTVIWLDFEGPGLPESRKIEKRVLLEFCCVFNNKKIRQGTVFIDFGLHVEVSFGARAAKKHVAFGLFFWRGPF